MEPTFFNVVIFLLPALGIIFFLVKHTHTDERTAYHNTYKNYRKTRMDKPVV